MPDFSYYTAVDQIYHADWTAEKFSRFERMKEAISELWPRKHPAKIVQIAGTSGKGSVCRFLEASFSLKSRTGAFTNPHLFDFRERFSISGKSVDQSEITQVWEDILLPLCVRQYRKNPSLALSFSEICVLMALVFFQRYEIEWAFLETGCGGRYERLSCLEAQAAVITSVGYDHPLSLGEQKWQRACDKAGIIRKSKPLFTAETDPQILDIFSHFCQRSESEMIPVGEEDESLVREFIAGQKEKPVFLSQEHQIKNASLALKVFCWFFPEINPTEALLKMNEVSVSGRFEEVSPGVYIDIAHNEDKIEALACHLKSSFHGKNIILVIALSNLRSPEKVFKSIAFLASHIIVTRASYSSVEPSDIARKLKNMTGNEIKVIRNPREAYKKALSMKDKTNIVLLTGSNYMIDQALNPDRKLAHLNNTYGWRYKREN
ncbi:hypothetical protein JW890_06535 [candidate division WOR-3 bacterium]|nr:hypothetical protein [candidate division WOR-3 bacterium]